MDFILVDTQELFTQTVSVIQTKNILAIDLECENNLHYYGSYLSIIQISSKEQNWVIDVLELRKKKVNLKPLLYVLTNKQIVKIFHDVDFDFRILNFEFQIRPQNIFDTKVAAQLLGKKELGLGSLLAEYFDVQKQKKFQKADWTKRPINSEMISYAIIDTAYLIRLYDEFIKALAEKNRLSWAQEEFFAIEQREFVHKIPEFLDVKGIHKLRSDEIGVFKELYLVREKLAKQVNRPVHFVLNNKLLFELAITKPSKEYFAKLKGVHPVVRKEAQTFASAIQKGLQNPIHIEKAKRLRLNQSQKDKLDVLLQKRDVQAKTLQINQHILVTKDQLIQYITQKQSLKKWQKEVLGLD